MHNTGGIPMRRLGKTGVDVPLNVMDAHFLSFEKQVLTASLERGMGIIGMKSFGDNYVLRSGAVTPQEALSYSLSLPVSVVVSGIDSHKVLHQNLDIAREFTGLSAEQIDVILAKTAPSNVSGDGRYELYKTSMRFDADVGRKEHGFPSMAELANEIKEFAQM